MNQRNGDWKVVVLKCDFLGEERYHTIGGGGGLLNMMNMMNMYNLHIRQARMSILTTRLGI